ncbi:protein shuttle craft [Parasteatoda tepidariorum]|uniref:protein shuttle craft n=1 Tax=Parasteatoda tepidariorum TaxID=114398 RepID=UPI00077FABB7|nr:protein shuttle craft [Parasteatoda tepidariorum]
MAEPKSSEGRGARADFNPRYFRNQRGMRYNRGHPRNYNSEKKYYQNSDLAATDSSAASNTYEGKERTALRNKSSHQPFSDCSNSSSINEDAIVDNDLPSYVNQRYIPKDATNRLSHGNHSSKAKFRSEEHNNGSSSNAYHSKPLHKFDYRKRISNSTNGESNYAENEQFTQLSTHNPPSTSRNSSTEVRQSWKHSKSKNIPSANTESYKKSDQKLDYDEESKAASQRGEIVDGRYIRRHANKAIPHSRSYNSFESSSNTGNTSLYCSYPPSRDQTHVLKEQQKTYYDFDYNRDYAYESMNHTNDNAKRKTHSNSRKYDAIASPTDVYHYSSGIDDEKKINTSSNRVFNKESRSSKLSRYKENDANQRELLIQHLSKGDCECLVCCESIRVKDQMWHCLSCYHVFHLRCIRKWARSPAATVEDGGWRCPACQSLTSKVPYDYYCFCGKQKNPEINYHITPHSCGEICSRKRPECTHLCKEICHPGPCPTCVIVVQKSCGCGKTFKTTTCKQSNQETCDSICDKTLNCGNHSCKSLCHFGECLPCEAEISQECYCSKESRKVICTKENSVLKYFSCGSVCEKLLKCGHHKCSSVCHSGSCAPCNLTVEAIRTCPCGQTSINELVVTNPASSRKSCEDPVPVCNKICNKTLFCGPKDKNHKCQSSCHVGPCPPCPLSTSRKCRCGANNKEFKCAEISPTFDYTCEKRCSKRKDCGRHKCLNKCCTNAEHRCELVCNKKLSCGNHQCQETCHAGNCPTCWNVSFDELRCHCGESVLYPPIHCGVKPPECSKPCIRSHSCDHEVKHTCHSDETCPPCTSLTVKWCYGHHKQCGSVMCFLDGVSCGMPCQNPLPCGKHECQNTCHSGPCLKPREQCPQVCSTPRTTCGHPCGNHCHDGSCPETPCKAKVTLTCPCGHRSEKTTCYDSTKTYRLMSVSVLASKMQEIKEGQSVNLNDVLGRKSKSSKLQCNEECAVLERNKRLAIALQIQNPDLSCSPGPPSYSEFLKAEAKKSPSFVSDVYSKISDLVQLAKESKQKCRSHSFPPMNRDQRRVVHELAEFFGCETQSYDEEPKKNVVVTAYKTKCWLPFVHIMTVVERDMGFRKGPLPVVIPRDTKNSSGASSAVSNQKKKIDYFDYKE